MRPLVSVAVTLVATVVPVHAATAAGEGDGAAPPPPSPLTSGGAAAPTPPPALAPTPAPLPAPDSSPEVTPELQSAPGPGSPYPGSAATPGSPPVPAAAPPVPPEPFAEPEVPLSPDSEKLTPRQTPEPPRVQVRISLNGVPALVAREQLGGPVAFTPPGEEPQLRRLAQVRDEPKRGGVDVQVPLDGDRPAEPAPPETARPQELPRTGLEVRPLAAVGFAMVIAGLGMLRVVPRRGL